LREYYREQVEAVIVSGGMPAKKLETAEQDPGYLMLHFMLP